MLSFVREALRDFRHTGAVWPSSPALAKAMTRSLRAAKGPKRLLEVGPGTGPFTKFVLDALRPGDAFDIVEINPEFVKRLERTMLGPFRARHPDITVRVHCLPIEEAGLLGPYDFIVCGLPFNNFPPTLVRSIQRTLVSMLGTGGELAYFEYAGVRVLKAPFTSPKGRQRLRRIDALGKSLRRKHSGGRQQVLGNFPPAFAMRVVRER
jgi:phospholipid N-methyltransferase